MEENKEMAQSFHNQVVLITGASSGFGAETARLFAKEGASLILAARRKERLEELKEELHHLYKTQSLVMQIDVSDEESVKNQFADLPDPFSTPNILVNNAGLALGIAKSWEINSDDWNKMIDINIKGILNMTRHILPKMLKANRGHIINVGSVAGHEAYPGGNVYCATKHAVRAFTDCLRMELVATPIRVSLISPGMAKTEFSLVRYEGNEKQARQVYENLEPLTALDIAETILFIVSRPLHVNIADIILYPKDQASTLIVHRKKE
jgi:3-hydroxy acid dehydrogenase/malonic semialdehyde reductase